MRGEYRAVYQIRHNKSELPPRARRIRYAAQNSSNPEGTTSAHAENTISHSAKLCVVRNYLRARGEYAMARSLLTTGAELPPRTRRIHFLYLTHYRVFGTTSAHAENTLFVPDTLSSFRNYLRARGEYAKAGHCGVAIVELPPRTRRILLGSSAQKKLVGNYLRARGEYLDRSPSPCRRRELPPRTRRIPNQ